MVNLPVEYTVHVQAHVYFGGILPMHFSENGGDFGESRSIFIEMHRQNPLISWQPYFGVAVSQQSSQKCQLVTTHCI